MSMFDNQWIELFRAGDYGAKGTYSEADIDSMIANYHPGNHEAPIVLGHPENDAPAFGWVESLKRSGNMLLGRFKQVSPQFEQMVRSGLFKKRSLSFLKNGNGTLTLRHVGFLGAMPPEVKGLADVKFAFGDSREFTIVVMSENTNICGIGKINLVPGIALSNVELAEDAAQLSVSENISYGEALMKLRHQALPGYAQD